MWTRCFLILVFYKVGYGSVRDDRGVCEDGCGWCSGDDGSGLDDGSSRYWSCDVGSCGHYRAPDREFVGVGVAGGNGHGVSHRDRCRGDERCSVVGCRCGEETWRWFWCWGGQGTGDESEQSDEFVHGCGR